ncbi:hypothetical protein [Streptomyces sp. NPDC058665]|uniref:hypothetical protein n=1 Tax=Streptomyces sp. NPDC058665 TaxID=3346586 RepID=UPI003654BB62
MPVAERLLTHQEGLTLDEDAEYWLGEMAAVLPNCRTPTQMVSLNRYLDATVRALRKIERRTASPVAITDDARLAYAAATEFLSR